MPRYSKTQKQVLSTIQDTPRRPRKKREVKQLPPPFKPGMAVKVSSPNDFKGYKLGLIEGLCKYNDGGIIVKLTTPRHEGVADPICIQTTRGHTIEILNDI